MNKKLTKLQIYNAIITFLDKYYWQNKSDNLSDFITYAFFWFDGRTADPAAWLEWLDTLKLTAQQDKSLRNVNRLTRQQALHAMVIFFKYYCSLYGSIPLDMATVLKILETLESTKNQHPMWQEWMNSIDEVIVEKDPRFYIQVADDASKKES